jgi:hypothetical protein
MCEGEKQRERERHHSIPFHITKEREERREKRDQHTVRRVLKTAR